MKISSAFWMRLDASRSPRCSMASIAFAHCGSMATASCMAPKIGRQSLATAACSSNRSKKLSSQGMNSMVVTTLPISSTPAQCPGADDGSNGIGRIMKTVQEIKDERDEDNIGNVAVIQELN